MRADVGAGRTAGGKVTSSSDDGTVTIALGGHLDAPTGAALVDAVRNGLQTAPLRIDIDLSILDSFVVDGAAALAHCRDLCVSLPDGLHYRTEGGAGQLALLSAFEREPEVDLFD